MKRFLTPIITALSVLVTIIAIIGAYHFYTTWLDSRIDSKMKDPKFMSELAKLSARPSLIFDEKESILVDMGARQFIKDIKVKKISKQVLRITISPKEHIGIEPLLEALDGRYVIRAEHGQMDDWIFLLDPIVTLVTEDSALRKANPERFRLELIR